MAGRVVDFSIRKSKARAKGKKTGPDKETVLLWQLSEAIDHAIRTAVLDNNLRSEEVAAILAHRLGTLIGVSPNKETLLEFCFKVIQRLNSGVDSNAS